MSGLLAMVIALAGFVTTGAVPAAAKPGTIEYVALGDSYAAGTAIQPGCPHTRIGYPALLAAESRIDLTANATCSGATVSDVADTLPSDLNGDTRLVTLTVGAADLDVSGVAATCLAEPVDVCLREIQEAGDRLPKLGSDLIDLYAKVAAAAPRARIVVTGYPYLYDAAPTDPIITAIRVAITALNATIEQAVTAMQDADVNIRYVDVTAAFAGHGIGSSDPFVHNLVDENNLPDPEAFHPNADGYRAYADAIKAKLPGGWLDKQEKLV